MAKRERMVMTQFHLHRELLQKLREYAHDHDTSVAQVIRVSVMNYLNTSFKPPVIQTSFLSCRDKIESVLNDYGVI